MRREVHVRFGEERQGDSFDYALSLTPLRVKGRWCYLYRAIDSRGATIDFLLSALRDADATKRLFRKVLSDRSHPQPRVINTDPAPIYSSAIPDSKKEGDAAQPLSTPTRAVLKQHSRTGSSSH